MPQLVRRDALAPLGLKLQQALWQARQNHLQRHAMQAYGACQLVGTFRCLPSILVDEMAQGGSPSHRITPPRSQPAAPAAQGTRHQHQARQRRGGDAVCRAGQFHHQDGAEGREAAAILWAECLPAIQTNYGGIGAEHGTVGQPKPSLALKHLPAAACLSTTPARTALA